MKGNLNKSLKQTAIVKCVYHNIVCVLETEEGKCV